MEGRIPKLLFVCVCVVLIFDASGMPSHRGCTQPSFLLWRISFANANPFGFRLCCCGYGQAIACDESANAQLGVCVCVCGR